MLPVVRGEQFTFWAIRIYIFGLMITTMIFYFAGALSLIYLLSALLLGSIFVALSLNLLHQRGRGWILMIYRYSMIYLGFLFLSIIVDSFLSSL